MAGKNKNIIQSFVRADGISGVVTKVAAASISGGDQAAPAAGARRQGTLTEVNGITGTSRLSQSARLLFT
jgi:hypothetical protein